MAEGVVFDGEVSGMQFKDTTEQLFRKTATDTSGLVYNVFDIVLPKYTLDERKTLLWDSVVKAVQERGRIFCKQVQLVYSFDFPLDFTKDKLIAMLTNLVKYDGFEGIVLKNKQSKYEPGKKAITSWVKGLIQHTGKNDFILNVADRIDNNAGKIISNANTTEIKTHTLSSVAGEILHAGEQQLQITAQNLQGQQGKIQSNNNLKMDLGTANLDNATTAAQNINLTATELSHQHGQIGRAHV